MSWGDAMRKLRVSPGVTASELPGIADGVRRLAGMGDEVTCPKCEECSWFTLFRTDTGLNARCQNCGHEMSTTPGVADDPFVLYCSVCFYSREGTAERAILVINGQSACEDHAAYVQGEPHSRAISQAREDGK